MITKIILGVSVLPVLLIMYFVLKGMGKEQNNTLFGISLWQDALKDERVQKVMVDYKKELNRWTLFFLFSQIPVYLSPYFSIMMILWMVWLFAVIIFINIPYVQGNKKMKKLKTEYQMEHGENKQNYTYIEVTAAEGEKPKYFQKSTCIACALGFIPAVLAVILDKTVNSPATPDLWVAELVLLSMALVGVCSLWATHYYNRQPVKVYAAESQVNIQFSRIEKYQWNRSFCAMGWMGVIFNGLMLAGFYLDSAYMTGFIIIICTLYCLIPLVFFGMSWYVIQKQRRKLFEGKELLLSEDDENWIWGMFYYNKNDNRLWVDKKVGIGFTANMAKKSMIVLEVVTIALVVVLCFGTGILCAMDEFTPIKLQYEEKQLTALHWKEEYQIEKDDIASVTLLDEVPSMSRTNGTGMKTVYKGKWYSREYQRRFKVCINPEAEPILMIETTDGTWYLLGDSKPEQTEEIYEELTEK